MPLPEFVTGIIISALKKAPYDLLKATFKTSDSLTSALYGAATKASEDFYNNFGDEFGTYKTSFLARNDNWDLIFSCLFYSSANISADTLNPEGFDGSKPATREAIEFFVQALQHRIKEDRSLDQLFAEKQHLNEQTEVKEGVRRIEQTLLEVREEKSQDRQEFIQHIESSMQSIMAAAFDVNRGKETSDEIIDKIIDTYRDLISDNKPFAAISVLEKLKEQKWKELPDRLRFRIATNIAAAKLRIGDNNIAAAQELLAAAKLVPKDKKAIFNSTIAHWILGNTEAAKKKAKEAVDLFPDDPESYQVLVLTLAGDEECTDPLPLIPPEVQSSPDIALQLGDFFQRKSNIPESRKWFRRAYELCNSNVDIQEGYATAQLDELFSEGAIVAGQQMTGLQRKQMQEARNILADIWAKVKDTEVSRRYIPCVINLSNAERLLGNEAGALSLIEWALSRHPDHVLLNKQRCFCLIAVGKATEACEILNNMPDDAFEGKLLVEAETLAAVNESSKALVKIERFLSQHPPTDDVESVLANAIRVQLLNKLESAEVALTAALDLANNRPAATEYLLLVSDMYANTGKKDKAIEWAEKARAVSLTNNSYPERVMVADTYYELGLHRQASFLYQELITSYEDSKNLRRLFSSYMAGDFRKEALELISRLPEQVKEIRFYGRACAELFYRLGDLPKARRHLEACIKGAPKDLELQLNYVTLLERMEQKKDVVNILNNLPEFEDASPEDLIKLSHAYARYGMQDKALQVGYGALRKFGSVATVHLGYCGLLLVALKDIQLIDRVRDEQKVDVNTAFTCLTKSGKRLTFVIEPNPGKDVEEEIAPDHVIARKAIGLKVNDKFVISENPFGKEEATIIEVKHKYLHALHVTMENFRYRFPDVPGMWMVGLDPLAEGGLDLQPILDAVSQRSDAVLRTEEIYATHPLPLALVAHHLHTHPIDCLLGISGGGRVKIKCCNGDSAEREKAAQTVLAAKDGFIIDPFSLYTLSCLNVLDVLLRVTKGKLGVTQSTLDLFAELIEERKTMQPFTLLSKKEDQFFRDEVSGEDIKLSIIPFENILAWCRENCEIVSAAGKPGLDGEGKIIFSGLHPVFLDTLLAAEGTGRVMISEDLHYRQVGKLLFEVEGVWSQPLLQVGIILKAISAAAYHEAVTHLINMNYGFISITAEDLLYQLEKQDWGVGDNFGRMISTISQGTTDIVSSVIVIRDFLCLLLQKTSARGRIEKATYAALNHLTSNPTRSQHEIIVMLWLLLVERMAINGSITQRNLKLLKILINSWCFGHFVSGIA